MADLRFIDAFCCRLILNAARGLGGSRKMIMRCSPVAASQFTVFGAGKMPGVHMVTVHDT